MQLEPKAWLVISEPRQTWHFARTKEDAERISDNLLKYAARCTSTTIEPLYLQAVRADLFDALTEERDRLKQWQADQVEVNEEAKALITELNADKKALEAERDRLERDRDFWKEQFQVETRYRIELADKGTLQALTDANSRMEKAEAERDQLALANAELLSALRITRDRLDSANHSEFDGVWSDEDFKNETAEADALLTKHKATNTEGE